MESTIFTTIETALAGTVDKLRLYSAEYDNEADDHVPPRPYVSIEYGSVDWEHEDGFKIGEMPVTLHIVQNNYTQLSSQSATKAKALELLRYKESIVKLVDGLAVDGDVLVHSGTRPDSSRRNYRVDVEEFTIRLRIRK